LLALLGIYVLKLDLFSYDEKRIKPILMAALSEV